MADIAMGAAMTVTKGKTSGSLYWRITKLLSVQVENSTGTKGKCDYMIKGTSGGLYITRGELLRQKTMNSECREA